jgi:hypothetical protein
MTVRGGGPTPTELRNMWPRGVPTYPLGIAGRWHRNLSSRTKERNADYARVYLLYYTFKVIQYRNLKQTIKVTAVKN